MPQPPGRVHATSREGASPTARDGRVILFDGVCRLCNAWVRFILRFDRRRRFRLCSMQSGSGQQILRRLGLPTRDFQSLVYLEEGVVHQRSEAILRILAQLPPPWPLLCLFRLVPAFIRDGFYDRVARHRYRIFGRYDHCPLPDAGNRDRFLE